MRGGFTLVETLVALAILVAVAGALVGLQVAGLRAQRAAERLHAAAALATDELVLQRTSAAAAAGACLAGSAVLGGTPSTAPLECGVRRECLVEGPSGCALVLVTVSVGASSAVGAEPLLEVTTAVAPWLEGRP